MPSDGKKKWDELKTYWIGDKSKRYYTYGKLCIGCGQYGGDVWNSYCDPNFNRSEEWINNTNRFMKCTKVPYKDSTHYVNHAKVNELLKTDNKRAAYSKIARMCSKPSEDGNGDLYKGSMDCSNEHEKMCMDGINNSCTYLKENEPDVYRTAMSELCKKPEHISSAVCKEYFKKNWNTNIEEDLYKFCNTTAPRGTTPRYKDPLFSNFCACHKPKSFYTKLRESIEAKWKGPPGMDQRPHCILPECKATDLFDKTKKCPALSFTQCIQDVNITAGGSIDNKGEINIKQDATCISSYSEKSNTKPLGPAPPPSAAATKAGAAALTESSGNEKKDKKDKKKKKEEEKKKKKKKKEGNSGNDEEDNTTAIILFFLFLISFVGFVLYMTKGSSQQPPQFYDNQQPQQFYDNQPQQFAVNNQQPVESYQ